MCVFMAELYAIVQDVLCILTQKYNLWVQPLTYLEGKLAKEAAIKQNLIQPVPQLSPLTPPVFSELFIMQLLFFSLDTNQNTWLALIFWPPQLSTVITSIDWVISFP